MTDAETAAAIEALAHRVKARDQAIRDGEDYPDAEPFAQEYLTALRSRGWRPTEAKVVLWNRPHTGSTGPTPEFLAAKAALAERLGRHDDPDAA